MRCTRRRLSATAWGFCNSWLSHAGSGEFIGACDGSTVGIADRGFQFADGVYEVIRIYNGKPFTLIPHLQRLWNSAVDIQLTPPLTTDALAEQIKRFIAHTGMREGMVYLQLTRGVAPRNH